MLSPSLPWQVRLRLSALRGVEQARVALGKGGTVRVGPWIVLCQAETPRLTPAGDVVTHVDGDQNLITSAIIAQVARVYDPRVHRAAIVASEEGNPHYCGEAEAPAGWIERVLATPTHLWGLPVEIIDEDGISRMEKWISAGWLHRSVCIGPRTDIEGGLYLRHLALSSGYPEGQGGNPVLSWYWPDALKLEAPGPRLDAFDSAGMFRLAYEPTGGEQPPQEGIDMDPAEVKSIIQEALGAMMEKIDAMGQATKDQMAANAEAVKEQVAAVESRLAAVEERVETGSKSDVEKTIRLSVQSLVDQGRLAPADADAEVKELLALPAELATSRLSRLSERTPINGGKMLVLPDGMKQRILGKKKAGEVKRTSDEVEAAAREAGFIAADAKPQDVLKGMDRFVREALAEAGA